MSESQAPLLRPGLDVRTVDLRSDTVTTPTPEMRRAMADAEVGDDVYGEDPTVNRLQSLAASLLGKEAALYVASGTMANQLAIRVLAEPGTEVLCPDRAHVYRYEAAAAPVNSGVQMHPLWDLPDGVRVAIEGVAHHLPRPSLVVIENTYMALSGAPIDAAEMATLCGIARGGRAPGACRRRADLERRDRARFGPRELVAPVDTVMFCLSKGLSAPVGSRAVRSGRRDRRGARASLAVGRGHAASGSDRRGGHRRAGDDGRAARRRSRAGPPPRRRARAAVAGQRRSRRRCAPTSCAPTLRRLPADFVVRLEHAGVRAGTIDARTVPCS